jgi:Zn ribbon nucleic-acid-binding protein
VPHLCLDYGEEITIDSRLAAAVCPKCGLTDVVEMLQLEGVKYPKCGNAGFFKDGDFLGIS